MPSVPISDSAVTTILPAKPGLAATIQNLANASIYLRWDGATTVTATSNADNSGIRLKKGSYIDIPELDAAVVAIGEPGSGSGLEVRYILRRAK